MCGIYVTNIPYSEDEIISKLESIKFRGPDNLGILKEGNVALGHLRLAIIDLDQRSNQPMTLENLIIVFNGEIYNFNEIRQSLTGLGYLFKTTSDTEVLLCGYKHWGPEVLEKLNGMFAFAIYDTLNQKIFCARDRLGVKPLYYYWKDGVFEICSQLRPLGTPKRKISGDALSIYLDCGYVPSPLSILEDVFKLSPGNFMEIDLKRGTKEIKEYWNLKKITIQKITYDAAKKELHSLLVDAVKIRLQSDVPLGSFLSGGIDSALVSGIASKISKKKINTFTIGFDVPEYDESGIAAQFAGIIGSKHIEIICGFKDALKMLPMLFKVFDEPFADSSAVASLLLNSVTRPYATVALSGDGGDESFLGYNHFDSINKFNKIRFIPYSIRKLLAKIPWNTFLGTRGFTVTGLLESKDSDDLAQKIFVGYESLQKNSTPGWLENYKGYRLWSKDFLQRAADLNIKLWLENDSNVKVDRASMAYAVEVRSPLLDYRVVEFARSLPVSYRYQRGRKKRILRDILKEYIPEKVFDQPKKGFAVPIKKWIREDLKDDILEELNDRFLHRISNLDIEKFKLQLNLHLQGKYDYSFNIWKLYILSKWYKEFNHEAQ